MIEAYEGEESYGDRRKYYRVTLLGKETFGQNLRAWRRATNLIDQLIEVQGKDKESENNTDTEDKKTQIG